MIRIVLVVLLSAAILAIALPAVDTARSQRAATLVTDEVHDLETTVNRFARRNDAVPTGTSGATRLTSVRVPTATTVRVRAGELGWTHRGRSHRTATELPLVGNLTLRPGRHLIRLSLHRQGGDPVVHVRRFKPETAATSSRVRNPLESTGVSL